MSTTYVDARDEMYGMVKTVIDAATTLIGYAVDTRWLADGRSDKVPMDKVWARVSHQIAKDGQAALANANGEKLFEAKGLLYVQLFCPRNIGGMLDKTIQLALNLQTAFRNQSPSGEVWFREQAVRQLPETDENYPVNFVTQFSYKTLQP